MSECHNASEGDGNLVQSTYTVGGVARIRILVTTHAYAPAQVHQNVYEAGRFEELCTSHPPRTDVEKQWRCNPIKQSYGHSAYRSVPEYGASFNSILIYKRSL